MCSRQGEGLTITDSDESDKQDALMSQFDSMLSSLQPSEDDKVPTQYILEHLTPWGYCESADILITVSCGCIYT